MKHAKRIIAILSLFLLVHTQFVPFLAGAITWLDDYPLIENDPGKDMNPSVTQTIDEKIWVVYSTNQYQPLGDLYYVTYNGSWSTQQRLTTDPNMDDTPGIIQAQDGVIWVVWSSDREEDSNIYYKTSSNDGGSWSIDHILTMDPAYDSSPAIAQSADGKIWVFWSSRRTGNYEIFYKTYDGSSWSPTPNQLTDHLSADLSPACVGTWDGNVWVVWVSARTVNYNLFYKTYDGSSWSPTPIQLTYDPDDDGKPSITQARDGSIWVVWPTDRHGNQFELYYNQTTDYGATWFADRITQSSKDDITPSIYNADDGTMWVVWSKYTGTNFDLYYQTSNPIPVHDVAITNITSAPALLPPIYQGDIVEVNVTAENQGTQDETFTVTCYANSAPAGDPQTCSLAAETSTELTFNWNTTGLERGDYIISASASVVPDEYLAHQTDNTMTDGTERVQLLGDINDDGRVNIIDLATIGKAYGTSVGDPLYNQDADINHDGFINITDLSTAARNYGTIA